MLKLSLEGKVARKRGEAVPRDGRCQVVADLSNVPSKGKNLGMSVLRMEYGVVALIAD
jgi:hypothetical protein